MRLRLYRSSNTVNSRHRPLIIDQFPLVLCDPAEWSTSYGGLSGLHECCEIKQVGNTFYVTDVSADESTQINGCPVGTAPILPGDRLKLNSTEFLVSYERLTSSPPVLSESPYDKASAPQSADLQVPSPVTDDAAEIASFRNHNLPDGILA